MSRLRWNDLYVQKLIGFGTMLVLCLVWIALDPDKERVWPLIPIGIVAIVLSFWLGEALIRRRKRRRK